MAEPARKFQDIKPDIQPHFGVVQGGEQSTPGRASLKAVNSQESNIKKPGNNTDDVKNAEEAPDKSWKNNVTGPSAGSAKSLGFMATAKKKGPLTAIILTLVGGGIGIMSISAPSLLMQSIYSNAIQKFNIQETSFTLRSNRIISRKLSGDLTKGVCTTVVTFACRFSRPSNRFLAQLEKNGITALDDAGKAIAKNGLFPNTRPSNYKFTTSAGDELTVGAADVYDTMLKNPELRDAFHKSSKTRFASLTDSVFDNIKARFGFSNNNKLKDVSTENIDDAVSDSLDDVDDTVSNSLDDIIDGNVTIDDNNMTELVAERTDDVGAVVDDAVDGPIINTIRTRLGDTLADAATQAAKSGKGDAITLTSSLLCGFADVPGMLSKAVRGFQMAQLIKYSALFLATFGAMRAGEATAKEASTVGNLLTEVVNGKSAMDSFGIQNTINGDTAPQNDSYKKFVPAAGIIAAVGGFAAIANSKTKKEACAVMSNPVTGAGINTALVLNAPDTLGTSLIAAGLNVGGGFVLAKFIEFVAPTIIKGVMDVIPFDKMLGQIMGFFVGDLTKGLRGEAVGDALISGASHTMGQTGNAGGNMPLTVSEAIAYNQETKEVQLAYAEEDRATKSPFDTSSPNTMMGSFVQKLIPYISPSYRIAGLASNSIASILSVVTGSFSTILSPLSVRAVDPGEEYKLCDDPEMQDNNIAAGPYCNIIYGVPTKYLDKDPMVVVNKLLADNNIDEKSGEPVPDSDLDKWIGLCTTGDTNLARNCKITDETANYALYSIDYRVQKSMDEELTPSSSSSTPETGGSLVGDNEQPANTVKKDKGWTLKPNVDYSGVACADGSTDKGLYTHPIKKFIIKLCETKLGRVSSLISQRVLDAIAAAKKDGVTLAGSTWRSYEAQQGLYRDNCARGHCEPPTAKPGNSQHERGIGTDFGNVGRHGSGPVWNWLVKNGAKYGYINLPSEGWHWSMSGG